MMRVIAAGFDKGVVEGVVAGSEPKRMGASMQSHCLLVELEYATVGWHGGGETIAR